MTISKTAKFDLSHIPRELDKRVKISLSQRDEIRRLYFEHGQRVLQAKRGKAMSQRALAKLYGVSRRLIVFVLHPERDKKLKDTVKKEKRWLKYYTTEKNTNYMKKHRKHKKELYNNNLLIQ